MLVLQVVKKDLSDNMAARSRDLARAPMLKIAGINWEQQLQDLFYPRRLARMNLKCLSIASKRDSAMGFLMKTRLARRVATRVRW